MCYSLIVNFNHRLALALITLFILFSFNGQAQSLNAEDVRYIFENTSSLNQLEYADNEIYIAVIGRSNTVGGGGGVFLDNLNSTTPNLVVMDPVFNTLLGPNGDLYGDVFTPLSDLPVDGTGDRYIDIPPMFGGQIWIGLGEPMYVPLQVQSYAGADIHNPSSPNFNNKFEIIEFTQTDNDRVISNTTRVDTYQYPMGQEVYGPNGEYIKVGETATHEQVLAKYQLFVDEPFLSTIDTEKGIIHQPTTVPEFQTGGEQANYFEAFIDQMWAEYSFRTLEAQWGGVVHTATVQGNQLVWDNGERIDKPTTAQIVGGTGPLNNDFGQILGVVLNRGVVDLSNMGVQVWDDESNYYQTTPKNDYTHFFHSDLVSFQSQTYAFAYDDVFDHSSTSTMDNAEKVVISIGGFGIEHTQVLTDVYIAIDGSNIDEFQSFQFDVKGLDQALFDMGLPNDAEITWSVVEDNSLIDQNGLFGPASVGVYNVNVQVESNGVTFSSITMVEVKPEGTSGQVCIGEVNQYSDYRIESKNDKVYITFEPRSNFNGNGWIRLFYERANGTGVQAYDVQANTAFELYGVFNGSALNFNYLYQAASPPQVQSQIFTIPSVGTCDGLLVEEYLTRIEIVEQNITLDEGDNIGLTVIGKSNEGNNFPVDGIIWSGEGVDQNGNFSTNIPGTYVVKATVNGIVSSTTITVVSTGCLVNVSIVGGSEVCQNEVLNLSLSLNNLSSVNWSGSGVFGFNDLNSETPAFMSTVDTVVVVAVDVIDDNGCEGSSNITVTVNPNPIIDLSLLPTSLCSDADSILLVALPSGGVFSGIGVFQDKFSPYGITDTLTRVAYNYTNPSTLCKSSEEYEFRVVTTTPPKAGNLTVFDQTINSPTDVPLICAEGIDLKWYETHDKSGGEVTSCYQVPFLDNNLDQVMDTGAYVRYVTQTVNECESLPTDVSLRVEKCVLTSSIDYDLTPNVSFENDTLKLCNLGDSVVFNASTNRPLSSHDWMNTETLTPLAVDVLQYSTNEKGDYFIIVKDQNRPLQCFVSSDTIHLKTIEPIQPLISIAMDTNDVCENDSQTIVVISENEGSNPLYRWFINDEEQSISDEEFETPSLKNGDKIEVRLISSASCLVTNEVTSNALKVLKHVIKFPQAKVNSDDKLCVGESNSFELSDTVDFGGAYTVKWFLNDTLVSSEFTSGALKLNTEDVLLVSIHDFSRCSSINDLSIPVNMGLVLPIKPIISSLSTSLCEGSESIILNDTDSLLSWFKNGEFFENASQVTINKDGEYYAEYDDGVCPTQVSNTVSIIVFSEPIIKIEKELVVFEDESVQLTPEISDYTGIKWEGSNVVDDTEILNPVITPIESGSINLEVFNGPCYQSKSVFIKVKVPLKVPNAFSPNGDGINDRWIIQGIEEYPNAHITIFNRWGIQLFEHSGAYSDSDAWSGEGLPIGTYYYILNLNDTALNTTPEIIRGAISITK